MIELDFDFEEILEKEIITVDMPTKNKARAERRKTDFKKAIRKSNIINSKYEVPLYDNLHRYSKNSICFSLPKCCVKEPASKATDIRKKDSMSFQLKEPLLKEPLGVSEATPDYYDGCEPFRWFDGAEAI